MTKQQDTTREEELRENIIENIEKDFDEWVNAKYNPQFDGQYKELADIKLYYRQKIIDLIRQEREGGRGRK